MIAPPVDRRALHRPIAAILLAAFVAGTSWPAAAHEPGTEWIMDGQFRSQSGEHCCSPGRDCQPIAASDVALTTAGWIYKPTGELVPQASVYRSRDPQDRFWRCEGTRHRDMNNKLFPTKTRCLFIGGTS